MTISSVHWRTPVWLAYWKFALPSNKTFILGVSPGISYKLWHIPKGKRNAYSLWIIFVSKKYCLCKLICVWNVLNIHIWTNFYTFYCKRTMCVSRVNGKSDRGNANEIQAICNNKKNWFSKCHSFWQLGINWKLVNANIKMAHNHYAKCDF